MRISDNIFAIIKLERSALQIRRFTLIWSILFIASNFSLIYLMFQITGLINLVILRLIIILIPSLILIGVLVKIQFYINKFEVLGTITFKDDCILRNESHEEIMYKDIKYLKLIIYINSFTPKQPFDFEAISMTIFLHDSNKIQFNITTKQHDNVKYLRKRYIRLRKDLDSYIKELKIPYAYYNKDKKIFQSQNFNF
jgi:hypothetical protein